VNEFNSEAVKDVKLTPEKFLLDRGFVSINPGEFWIINNKLRKVISVNGCDVRYLSMNGNSGLFTSDCSAIKSGKLRRATQREIVFFLIEEAVRRKFSDGVEYVSPVGEYIRKVSGELKVSASYDVFDDNGHLIYSDRANKWGLVIE